MAATKFFKLSLPAYCKQICVTNPGTIAAVYSNKPELRRLFVAYRALISGFKSGCRTLLGLDGTHLRSEYFGTLLAATVVDGDGPLFPLTMAVVDAKNDEN
uniref:MULE transposase domain-containing protein n=1 Tax=Peronospora matthiolae TaxID=2874970 RepID=A0AAV1T7S8_9STRA